MSLYSKHEPKIDLEAGNFMKMANFREKKSRAPETLCSPVKLRFVFKMFNILSDYGEKISLYSEHEPKIDLDIENFMKMTIF